MNLWGPGPWESEPEAKVWTTDDDLDCEIKRHADLGHLCGYVSVPQGHPLHGIDVDDSGCDFWPSVHGGVTFCGETRNGVWTFGFDCAHGGDLWPYSRGRIGGVYRDFAYVEAEVEKLAKQIADYKPKQVTP